MDSANTVANSNSDDHCDRYFDADAVDHSYNKSDANNKSDSKSQSDS